MSRCGRDPDEIRLEIAYAIGEGRDPVEHIRRQKRAERRDRDA